MIRDFRETLEITPITTSSDVSVDSTTRCRVRLYAGVTLWRYLQRVVRFHRLNLTGSLCAFASGPLTNKVCCADLVTTFYIECASEYEE